MGRQAIIGALLLAWLGSALVLADSGRRRSLAQLLAGADEVARVVSRLRGLPGKRPLKKAVVSKAQVRRYILSRINAEYSAAELTNEAALLTHFGIIPRGTDYRKYVVSYLTAQLAGYYDPDLATLFIADWIPASVQAPVLAHEILHALQDQHFGLKRFIKRRKGELDATLAKMALVEGEGMALMYMYSFRHMQRDLPALAPLIMPNLPTIYASVKQTTPHVADYLIRMHLFSYVYGLRFVVYMVRNLGWRGVNAVYRRLPATTEQVMHPEKYLRNELGKRVSVARPAHWDAAWQPVLRNVQGEFGLALLLQTRLPQRIALAAARGWDGDQLALFRHRRNGKLAVILQSYWDDDASAARFAHAYGLFLRARLVGAARIATGSSLRVTATDGTVYRVLRQGRRVQVIEGDPRP